MYALVEIQGKQFKVEKGSLLKVDRVEGEAGAAVDFDTVLLLSGDSVKVGSPYVAGAKVKTVIESHAKDKKVIVFKYQPKKDRRRKIGHRQALSFLRVQDIVGA
jgi:large subunit ribosomal protein L21